MTIQVVQPLPLNMQGIETTVVDTEDSTMVEVPSDLNEMFSVDSEDSGKVEASPDLNDTSSSMDRLVHQKHTKRPMPESSPTQTTRSPQYKEVSRRSRSFTESTSTHPSTHSLYQSRRALFLAPTPSSNQPLHHVSYNHYTPLRSNHYLHEFHPTEEESRELCHLKNIAFLFITLR